MQKIKVGITGVNTNKGFASLAHIPAIKSLSQYKLQAISNRSVAVAEEAGRQYNVPLVFDDNKKLIDNPEIDLVSITVRVTEHRKLVELAIDAGKSIYCEWPLGNGLQEAEELLQKARDKGIHGFIGLQSRAIPAFRYIKDIIKNGKLGEIQSTTLLGSGIIYGDQMPQSLIYSTAIENGAGMIYSTFGNAVDALCHCLGEFKELNATAVNRRKTTTVIETGEQVPVTAYDQIAVNGLLTDGTVASIHYRGGTLKDNNFMWEINGSEGYIIVTGNGGNPGTFAVKLKMSLGGDDTLSEVEIPEEYLLPQVDVLSIPAANVAYNYERIFQDLQHHTHTAATFYDAVVRQRMIQAIEIAAQTGEKQSYQF